MFVPAVLLLICATCSSVLGTPTVEHAISTVIERSISQTLLNDLTRFAKYSSAAYQNICPSPLGNSFVLQFSDLATNTQGFVTRDDANREIIVSYRGSLQLQDFLTDADIFLVPFSSPGVPTAQTGGVLVHQGFLNSFNSVASVVIQTVAEQIEENPSYSLVSAGHSLGGSLASLGAVSLAANFPGKPLQMFTFGQPRTGNPAYASMVENLVGVDNIFRAVHTFDGVPTLIPQGLGFRHHATEFWNFADPSISANVKQCSGDEDPTCSDSIPSSGINAAHIVYFGQAMALDPSLCV